MTQFMILATLRSLLFQAIFAYATRTLIKDRSKRLVAGAVVALVAAAGLDGITPDGWDFENVFGHPAKFYLFANAPFVLAVLAGLVFLNFQKDRNGKAQ